MSDHKLNERKVIDRAFTRLRVIFEQDAKAERWLEEAYRYERRERSSMAYTQALLVDSFLKGYDEENGHKVTAAYVFGYSEGCGKLYVLGATARLYSDRFKVVDSDLNLLREAVRLNQESINRRLAALRVSA